MQRFAFAALAFVLSACATIPGPAPAPQVEFVDAPFDVSGRLSARRGSEGAAANFAWEHMPGRDTIALATPLGSTLARLERRADGATMVLASGAIEHAPDVTTLAARALGMPLPVESLAWWIRGAPHPGSQHAIEHDAAGRTLVLRQDGWSVVYSYADAVSARPLRLYASYPDLEVRVVIDAWRKGSEP